MTLEQKFWHRLGLMVGMWLLKGMCLGFGAAVVMVVLWRIFHAC